MTVASYVLGIAAPLVVIGFVLDRLRRRRLRERHALWWIVAGVFALVVGMFPDTLAWLAAKLGVEVPANLLFFLSIAVLFLVGVQYASELTKLEAHTRTLAERIAILELGVAEHMEGTSAGRLSRPGPTVVPDEGRDVDREPGQRRDEHGKGDTR